MIPMTAAEIGVAVGGRCDGDPAALVRAEAFLNSRDAVPGGLFVAIAGERADGHDFAEQAIGSGAAMVLAAREVPAPAVVVDDVPGALGRLARSVLDRLDQVTVLAMTGSQGKTGTKDYLSAILGSAVSTVATAGNLNNELGVPLTVLRATHETRCLVVEMGARAIGNIEYLCQIAPPTVAAVLSVGTAHLGEFGSREAIALTKGEIVEALPEAGVAVLNADDPRVMAMASRTTARVLTFGAAGEVTWRGVELDGLGRPTCELGYDGTWIPLRLRQSGAHQVTNAVAAAAMAIGAGLDFASIVPALEAAGPASRWRMELHERTDGLTVVNDAYNANPASMRAAIETLASIGSRTGRRTVAVLGEMRELGPESAREHRDLGVFATRQGIDVVVAVGSVATAIADAARTQRDWPGIAVSTVGRADALSWLRDNVSPRDVVLVKASRFAALERIAEALLETEEVNR
jgi:UDP-N-acetylmuramoyl-tripeptide--D-alanyl-D-alanine ligase